MYVPYYVILMHFWSLCVSKKCFKQIERRSSTVRSKNILFPTIAPIYVAFSYVRNALITCGLVCFTKDSTSLKLSNAGCTAYRTNFRTLLYEVCKKQLLVLCASQLILRFTQTNASHGLNFKQLSQKQNICQWIYVYNVVLNATSLQPKICYVMQSF